MVDLEVSPVCKSFLICILATAIILLASFNVITMMPCDVFPTDEISDIIQMVVSGMMAIGAICQAVNFFTIRNENILTDHGQSGLKRVYMATLFLTVLATLLSTVMWIWTIFISHSCIWDTLYFVFLSIFLISILTPPYTLVTFDETRPTIPAFICDHYLLSLCVAIFLQVNFLEAKETLELYGLNRNCTPSPFRYRNSTLNGTTVFKMCAYYFQTIKNVGTLNERMHLFSRLMYCAEPLNNDYCMGNGTFGDLLHTNVIMYWYEIVRSSLYAVTVEIMPLLFICYLEQKKHRRKHEINPGNGNGQHVIIQQINANAGDGNIQHLVAQQSVVVLVNERPVVQQSSSCDVDSSGQHSVARSVDTNGNEQHFVNGGNVHDLIAEQSNQNDCDGDLEPLISQHSNQCDGDGYAQCPQINQIDGAGNRQIVVPLFQQADPINGECHITKYDCLVCLVGASVVLANGAVLLYFHISEKISKDTAQAEKIIICKLSFFGSLALYLVFLFCIIKPWRFVEGKIESKSLDIQLFLRTVSKTLDIQLLRWSTYGTTFIVALFLVGAICGPYNPDSQSIYNYTQFGFNICQIWLQYSYLYHLMALNEHLKPTLSSVQGWQWKLKLRMHVIPLLVANICFWIYDLWQWKTVNMLAFPAHSPQSPGAVWAVTEAVAIPISIFWRFHSIVLCYVFCHVPTCLPAGYSAQP